jgi:hypothetical protein
LDATEEPANDFIAWLDRGGFPPKIVDAWSPFFPWLPA